MSGSGSDTVQGSAGNDLLEGEDGNDVLYGGAGTDVLDGGNGNDVIHLDGGDDWSMGGAGADVFIFGQTGAIALIQDFDAALDRLDVSQQDIGTLSELAAASYDATDGLLLTVDANSLYLEGITLADLTADTLIFS